jgi:hypothetical protein
MKEILWEDPGTSYKANASASLLPEANVHVSVLLVSI